MQDISEPSLIAFSSESEAVKWLLNEVYALRKENIRLREEMAKIDDFRANQIAEDRQRLAKLEHPHKPQDTGILDELHDLMKARGLKQVDFATAAKMVKRSKSRLLQLRPEIGQDMRFVLVPSESHSQKVLIRLRQ